MSQNELLQTLEAINARLSRIEAKLGAPPATTSRTPDVADASDLDGKWGDEDIKFMPRDWVEPDFTGMKMSQCSVEFLEAYAKMKDWQAERDASQGKVTSSGKPTAPFNRKSAARARGWAQRMRTGAVKSKAASASMGSDSGWAPSKWPSGAKDTSTARGWGQADAPADADIPF